MNDSQRMGIAIVASILLIATVIANVGSLVVSVKRYVFAYVQHSRNSCNTQTQTKSFRRFPTGIFVQSFVPICYRWVAVIWWQPYSFTPHTFPKWPTNFQPLGYAQCSNPLTHTQNVRPKIHFPLTEFGWHHVQHDAVRDDHGNFGKQHDIGGDCGGSVFGGCKIY